jgi:hypothetical protein
MIDRMPLTLISSCGQKLKEYWIGSTGGGRFRLESSQGSAILKWVVEFH